MKNSNFNRMIGRRCLALALAAVLLLGLMTGCSGKDKTWQSAAQESDSVVIDMKYGAVTLTDENIAAFRYMVTEKKAVVQISGAAQIGESLVSLFEMYLNSEDGETLGTMVTGAGETVRVGVSFYDVTPGNDWTEEDASCVYRMQNLVNDIAGQLGVMAAEESVQQDGTAVSVSTSVGELSYMDYWNGAFRLEEHKGDTVVIRGFGKTEDGQEQQLFAVVFGGTEGEYLGLYTRQDGTQVPVYLQLADETAWAEAEQNTFRAMQSVVNEIIGQLSLNAESAAVSGREQQEVSLETPYGRFTCTGEWAGALRLAAEKTDGYAIAAYGAVENKEEQKLFEIVIGGAGEIFAGYLADTWEEVNMTVPEIQTDDSWNEVQKQDLAIMQGQLNSILGQMDLIDQIPEEPKQEEASPEAAPELDPTTEISEDICINTSYGTMHYPIAWVDQVQIRHNTNNGYIIGFYAVLENKPEVHLFDIIVGGNNAGDLVGILTAENGNRGEMMIYAPDLVLDDSWSEEERNTVMAMQGDLNYLLQKLAEDGILKYIG